MSTSAVPIRQFSRSKDWDSASFGQMNIFQRSARQTSQGCALNLAVFQLVKIEETAESIKYNLKYDITSDEGSCYTLLSFKLLLNQSPISTVELAGQEPLNTRRGVHELTFDIPISELANGDYSFQVTFTGRGVPIILRSAEFVISN